MINRKVAAVAGTAVLALGLTSCAESQRDTEGGTGDGDAGATEGQTGDAPEQSDATFTFAAAGAPTMFDPFYASDGETFRVTNQIYDGLLDFEEGTATAAPGLATDWESSEDGLTWTFNLRDDVTFHDGTEFNAEAVCANFDRWYNTTGPAQSSAVTYYWNANFGGFADQDAPSLFESCEATDDYTVDVNLTRYTSSFPTALALSAFSIHSPEAMEEYNAEEVTAKGSGFEFPEYALEHPTGTGPFKFVSYDDANGTVTLERNDDYWGDPAGVKTLVFRIIPDEATRRQELEAGSIDGYDLPNPVDWASLEEAGNQVEIRPPFNILYLGLNPTTMPELTDFKVRQALYHAINREQLVQSQLPEGAEVATQFMPPTVSGYNDQLEPYEYDPEKAQQLLEEAGQEDLEIDFWYPTEVTRPYLPDPERVFEAIRSDWEEAGITVNPVSKPWAGGYLDGAGQGEAPAFLLGWTGDFDNADNFIGTFFGQPGGNFSVDEHDFGEELMSALDEADSEPDEARREEMYQEINQQIMEEYLPGLPISHSPPAIVVSERVQGLVASPITKEDFATVTIDE